MADAEDLFALVDSNREHLGRWLEWVDGIRTVEDERQWVQACMADEAQGQGSPPQITYRDTLASPPLIIYQDTLAGAVGIIRVDRLNNTCEIGYWLAQDLQGRGIVTRSCSALLDYAFGSMGMNRVEIRVVPENKGSLAIPERLGFVFESVLREAELLHGQYHDLRLYSMLASEWADSKASEIKMTQARS